MQADVVHSPKIVGERSTVKSIGLRTIWIVDLFKAFSIGSSGPKVRKEDLVGGNLSNLNGIVSIEKWLAFSVSFR
jgi:hypothetical protein